MFLRKPGKLAATTRDVWIGIISRRQRVTQAEAAIIADTMIADGRLIPSAEE
jgi:hypothetical protein